MAIIFMVAAGFEFCDNLQEKYYIDDDEDYYKDDDEEFYTFLWSHETNIRVHWLVGFCNIALATIYCCSQAPSGWKCFLFVVLALLLSAFVKWFVVGMGRLLGITAYLMFNFLKNLKN